MKSAIDLAVDRAMEFLVAGHRAEAQKQDTADPLSLALEIAVELVVAQIEATRLEEAENDNHSVEAQPQQDPEATPASSTTAEATVGKSSDSDSGDSGYNFLDPLLALQANLQQHGRPATTPSAPATATPATQPRKANGPRGILKPDNNNNAPTSFAPTTPKMKKVTFASIPELPKGTRKRRSTTKRHV